MTEYIYSLEPKKDMAYLEDIVESYRPYSESTDDAIDLLLSTFKRLIAQHDPFMSGGNSVHRDVLKAFISHIPDSLDAYKEDREFWKPYWDRMSNILNLLKAQNEQS